MCVTYSTTISHNHLIDIDPAYANFPKSHTLKFLFLL